MMFAKWNRSLPIFMSVLILSLSLGSELSAIVASMGNKHACSHNPSETHWISERTSATVIGKSDDSLLICRLKFGLATAKEGARLRLSFDFLYNHACGVFLQINESASSDFLSSSTNREMLMSGCHNRDPGPLFAQPKNFVLISLLRQNDQLEAYNFRLNISLADRLPPRGPEQHVVIIVGLIVVAVVVLVLAILYKYITWLSYHWHVAPAQETTINVFSSQEHLPDSQLTYMTSKGHQRQPNGARSPALNGQIARGMVDESVAMQEDNTDAFKMDARQNLYEPPIYQAIGRVQVSGPPLSSSRVIRSAAAANRSLDFGDSVSLGGCDVPPSYEEALGMPLAFHAMEKELTVAETVEEQEESAVAEPVEEPEESAVAEPVEQQEESVVAEPVEEPEESAAVAEPVEEQEESVVAEPVEEPEESAVAEHVEEQEVVTETSEITVGATSAQSCDGKA